MWVEVEGLERTIYVAVVYLVPRKSARYGGNAEVRRELEEDIVEFRGRGMVVVVGDVNSSIGECVPLEGVVKSNVRKNKDKKTNENGRKWILMMRRTGMVMPTGFYGRAEYTCYNAKGTNVVGHICVDRESSHVVKWLENRKEVM